MQTMTQTELLGMALDGIAQPIETEASPDRAEPVLFESVTRKKASDGIVLGLMVLLYASTLATGLWMALDVARGLVMVERCDGKCVEAAR